MKIFKLFFLWLADVFTDEEEVVITTLPVEKVPVVEDSELETETSYYLPQTGVFAWVIGHNRKYQGARNYLGESEFVFSSRVMAKAQIKLSAKGYKSVLVYRPPVKSYSAQCRDVAKQCEEQDVKFAILSHFNAFNKVANGCVFLVNKTESTVDDEVADMATDLLNERLGIKERGTDGVKTLSSNHNGWGMMNALKKVGILSTIAEPCFANFNTKESRSLFENEDIYVDILVDVAVACCSGRMKLQLH